MKLYEIREEMLSLHSDVETNDGVITDEQMTELGELNIAFEDKAESICKVIRNLNGEANSLKEEAQRLKSKADARSRRIGELKDFLKETMELLDIEKFTTPDGLFKPSIQSNSKASVVWLGKPEDIPEPYRQQVPPKPNLKKALEDHESGKLGEGWKVERGTHLRIR
ncbi:hypothetical protein LCGC14_0412160 [marine sediment metagenome]|uniref:Siphovirus Gp157 family protein n=1 Tax=marine sediment metagenome TaxID=412755 RepID=A0A0F9STK1_9ZZZZ